MTSPPPRAPSRRRALLSTLAFLGTRPAAVMAAAGDAALFIPGSAGTTLDLLGRHAAQALQDAGPYTAHNLPGGGGVLAAQRVLQSAAGERALLLSHAGLMCIVPQQLRAAPPFSPLDDFVPLAILSRAPFVLYTGATSGIGDMAALRGRLDAAAPPSYAVLALYGGDHLSGAGLFRRLGVPATAVAYKQGAQALLDVASGRVPYGIASWGNVKKLLLDGRLRALCTLSRQRLPFAPEIPALDELGLSDCAYEGWHGVFRRADAPAQAYRDEAAALRRWGETPGYADTLGALGYRPGLRTGEAASSFVRKEIDRHQALLQGLSLQ